MFLSLAVEKDANSDCFHLAVLLLVLRSCLDGIPYICKGSLRAYDSGFSDLRVLFEEILSVGSNQLPSWVCRNYEGYSDHLLFYVDDIFLLPRWFLVLDRIKSRIVDLSKEDLQQDNDISISGLNTKQQEAVHMFFKKSFSILVGGPGTGKSYTANKFIHSFLSINKHSTIVACAPTGKAVSNLKNAFYTNDYRVEFRTIHSLLGVIPFDGCKYSNGVCLPHDLIVVDESSMIDPTILAMLFGAMHNKARLILIGDPNQLPPVGCIDVFGEIVSFSKKLDCVTELDKVKRTDVSDIALLCSCVITGNKHQLFELIDNSDSITWIDKDVSDEWYYEIVDCEFLFSQYILDCKSALHAGEKTKILCPLKNGKFGIDIANSKLTEMFLRFCFEKGITDCWIPGIVTRNCSEFGIYNGEHCCIGSSSVVFLRCGDVVHVPCLEHVRPCWCMSVHKSQGSEFEEIYIVIPKEASRMFSIGLLYTSLSRGKKRITIWSCRESIEAILDGSPVSKNLFFV